MVTTVTAFSVRYAFRQSRMAAMLTGCENYNAPYSSSSSTCCSYQKDKQAMPGSLPKKNALSKIEEQRMEKYSHFFFTWCVICDAGNGNRKHYENCV